MRANTEPDPARVAKLHEIALAGTSPKAVRHAAVVAQVKALSHEKGLDKSSLKYVLEKHLQCEDERYLEEQLEEFYL